MKASAVCLEITENSLLDAADTVMASPAALRQLGLTLAVDDFGPATRR